jgi:hypothetical protein
MQYILSVIEGTLRPLNIIATKNAQINALLNIDAK